MKLSRIVKKQGNLTIDFTDYIDFWVKNGGDGVGLDGLGEMGKAETIENERKYSKMCEK